MSRKTLQLDEEVYTYLLSNSLREPEILEELRRETAAHPQAEMQIAPEQGQFLSFLVKALNVKTAIEIGVFTGYSSLSIALALPEDGRLVACDNDPKALQIAEKYWARAGVADRIELRFGAAIASLDALIAEGLISDIDFAFIDAHKPEYIDYYERILKLLRPGGVIVVDNVLWSGKPADLEIQDSSTVAIREFNRYLHKDMRVSISMLPVADGITLAMKNFISNG